LREKTPTLRYNEYKTLYDDLIRVIGADFTTKEFKDVQQKGAMNASNQFTREVL
jgi:hypothetical protein